MVLQLTLGVVLPQNNRISVAGLVLRMTLCQLLDIGSYRFA